MWLPPLPFQVMWLVAGDKRACWVLFVPPSFPVSFPGVCPVLGGRTPVGVACCVFSCRSRAQLWVSLLGPATQVTGGESLWKQAPSSPEAVWKHQIVISITLTSARPAMCLSMAFLGCHTHCLSPSRGPLLSVCLSSTQELFVE